MPSPMLMSYASLVTSSVSRQMRIAPVPFSPRINSSRNGTYAVEALVRIESVGGKLKIELRGHRGRTKPGTNLTDSSSLREGLCARL